MSIAVNIQKTMGDFQLKTEFYAEIERPSDCYVDYIDYYGKKKTLKASGLLATCIQHEVDHLNGILFIDYLSKLKKDMIIKKLLKQKKEIGKIVL